MSDLQCEIGDAVLEIIEAVYAAKPSATVDGYLADADITREQLAAAAIASMILERYHVSPAN